MANKQRLLKTFLELLKINSPSGKEEVFMDFLEKKLISLDVKVVRDSYGNLIGKTKGEGDPLLLAAHADTVDSTKGICIKIKNNIVCTDKSTILGADDKSGIAIIIEILEIFRDTKIRHRPLEIIFTREEEKGLIGIKNLDFSILTAKEGINIDEVGRVSELINQSVGMKKIEGLIYGKEAHSSEPEKGVHAIRILSNIISNMPLGWFDKETMVNIGMVKGGKAINTIPGDVHFFGEIRGLNKKKMDKCQYKLEKIFRKTTQKMGGNIELSIIDQFDSFNLNRKHPLLIKIKTAMKKKKLMPKFNRVMGGSDANIFNTKGIDVISLPCCYYNPHSKDEYANIKEMAEAVDVLRQIIII